MVKKVLAALAASAVLAGVSLIAAPAASAVTPRRLVDTWYGPFLDHYGPDLDPDSRYWVDQIDAGAKPSDVLWAIARTEEHHALGVELWYSVYLGRLPDPGARYWVDGATAGRFLLEWVQQNVAASPEHTASPGRQGLLVEGWFSSTAGSPVGPRQLSSWEVDYWTGRVRTVDPLAGFREIYYTPEAVEHRIEQWYHLLLQRYPSDGERAYWYPREVESDINVGVLIASTPEYAALISEVVPRR